MKGILRACQQRILSTATDTPSQGISIALVAQLRKETQVSLSKARAALVAVGGQDLGAAKAWLQARASADGTKAAEKVQGRQAAEGLIALSLLPGSRGSLVEVNCETDFVARSAPFQSLSGRIAASHLFLISSEAPSSGSGSSGSASNGVTDVDSLLNAPLMPSSTDPDAPNASTVPSSVHSAVLETIGRVGEKIQVRRAVSLSAPSSRLVPSASASSPYSLGLIGGYIHGDQPTLGRIGGLVSLQAQSKALDPLLDSSTSTALETLAKRLAQHVVGFHPKALEPVQGQTDPDQALLTQTYLLGGGSIQQVLQSEAARLGLESLTVMAFERLELGEGLVKEALGQEGQQQQQVEVEGTA